MIEVRMPEAGFSITEGTVIEWYKKVGDAVDEGENVVSVETDKITVDVPAEGRGVLEEVRYTAGEVVPVGDVLGIIEESGEKVSTGHEKDVKKADEGHDIRAPQKKISPAAKATARLHGVDVYRVEAGTGPGGRIVKKDILAYLEKSKEQRVDFNGWRRVIAERMVKSATEVPHYMMSVEADVTELRSVIDRLRTREGLHITYLPFMMKAIEAGIQEVGFINAWCDGSGYTIKEDLNIGIAVDLGEKLLVPVVKDVRSKSVLELTVELEELIGKTREEKLEPADVEGGTITLTNVGMFATSYATSVIVQPQVAIVYMGAAVDAPAVVDAVIEIRKKMTFGATFDHRVVNGAAGGRFLKRIKECLEDMGELALRLR